MTSSAARRHCARVFIPGGGLVLHTEMSVDARGKLVVYVGPMFAGKTTALFRAAGRDPSTLLRSVAQVLCVGADEAEIARRAARIGREVDELRAHGLAGTPDELIAKARAFADIGVSRIYLQVLDLDDLHHVDLVADAVMPALADR